MYEVKLNVGDEVVFFEGRNSKPVAYHEGKVVLCKHKIPFGYAKIKKVEDRGRYFLVTADHIVRDVYTGINYEDFMAVLPLHGFKVGFDKTFAHHRNDDSVTMEHQIFAYNPHNNVVIVAETFTWEEDERAERMKFNSINVYCPQINAFQASRCNLFSHGCGNMTVYDLERGYSNSDLLSWINQIMENIDNPIWPAKEYPSLWTYEDNDCTDENGNWDLGTKNLKKLLDAPKEALNCFKGCNWVNDLAS